MIAPMMALHLVLIVVKQEILLVLSSSNSLNRGAACAGLARAVHYANKAHNQTTMIKSKREKLTLWDRELEGTHGSLEQQRPVVLQC
jgi:hypothetical protein